MPVQHRETVEQQGVEAVLLGVGESHVELLRPLGPDTAVARFLERSGPGLHHVAYGTDDIESPWSRCARPACADRRAAPHRHPRQPRGVPAPEGDRRGAHRDCASSGGALMADESRRIDIGFQGGAGRRAGEPDAYEEPPQGARQGRGGSLVRTGDHRLEGLDRPVPGRLRPDRHRRAPRRLPGRPWTSPASIAASMWARTPAERSRPASRAQARTGSLRLAHRRRPRRANRAPGGLRAAALPRQHDDQVSYAGRRPGLGGARRR